MRTCIITGAASGIGRATAVEISTRDDIDNIILISLGLKDLQQTKLMMNPKKNILIYDQDITNYNEIKKIVDDTYDKFDRIDILLNIAGYSKEAFLMSCSLENWKKTFNINVTSVFMLTKFVVNYMKKTGGIILNVASTSGSTPRPGWIAYAASKSALIGFSRTLTEEMKSYNIRVYNLSPGRCATIMRKELMPDEDQSQLMQPEDVASVIKSLLSIEDNFIDGQDIIVRKKTY